MLSCLSVRASVLLCNVHSQPKPGGEASAGPSVRPAALGETSRRRPAPSTAQQLDKSSCAAADVEAVNADETFCIPPRLTAPSLTFGCSVSQAQGSFPEPSAAHPSSSSSRGRSSSTGAAADGSHHAQPAASPSTALDGVPSVSGRPGSEHAGPRQRAQHADQAEHARLAALARLYNGQEYMLAWQGGGGRVLMRQGYQHPRILQCIWQVRFGADAGAPAALRWRCANLILTAASARCTGGARAPAWMPAAGQLPRLLLGLLLLRCCCAPDSGFLWPDLAPDPACACRRPGCTTKACRTPACSSCRPACRQHRNSILILWQLWGQLGGTWAPPTFVQLTPGFPGSALVLSRSHEVSPGLLGTVCG